jgi:putative addiction module killer protein
MNYELSLLTTHYSLPNIVLLYKFHYLCGVKRRINTYGGYFERFLETLNTKELQKLNAIISLLETSDRMPVKFIKHVRDGLYELRMEFNGNIYRIFFIFDEGNIVVLFNGFQKKTQKTPDREIKKAIKIKDRYYADKRP